MRNRTGDDAPGRTGHGPPAPAAVGKILLVEDDEDDASLFIMALQRANARGHEVHHVRGLAEARDRMDREPYDVVLTDLGLPDASGTAIVASLVGHGSKTPVVVLSGWEDTAVAEQVHTLGAYAFLVKGLAEPAALRRVLENAAGRIPPAPRASERGFFQTGMPYRPSTPSSSSTSRASGTTSGRGANNSSSV